jgi:replicative DNA helicase
MELEYAVLACVWIDDKLTKVKLSELTKDLFVCWDTAKKVLEYREQGLPYDLIITKEHLGADLTTRLITALSSSAGLGMYDFYIARLKLRAYTKRIASGEISIDLADKYLKAIKVKSEKEKLYSFEGKDLQNYTEEVEKRKSPDYKKITVGDYKEFTEKFNYLRPGQSIVVGARTGIGKTQLMVNFMSHFMKQNIPCLYITAEVSYLEICDRLVALNSDYLNQWQISNGEMDSGDWQEFTKTIQTKLYGKKSVVYEVSQFNLQKIKDLITRYSPQIVFVDFLQRFKLSTSSKSETRASVLSDIANEIKSIAMDKSVTIISASQLNRNSDDKAPSNADFKESGGIEEAADKCLLIYGEVKGFNGRAVKIKISKNRQGQTGHEFDFCFDNKSGRLEFVGICV